MALVSRWNIAPVVLALALGAPQAPAAETVMTQNNVSFISGGVGLDSEERLKAREKEFSLKLVFTLIEGNYVADVGVKVADAAGRTLVEHVADGPFFLAKLPAGSYSVTATHEGRTHSRKVKVAERLRTEYFRWPSNPQTDFVLPPENRK
ncbi:MAG: carboxypeptidase regulatory-like domain-containing protein [Betaproteobacteria bacterium]|nr:carboxypeptidase regulatory-like domain-containing protein [Betaproteobacteria bacterium]